MSNVTVSGIIRPGYQIASANGTKTQVLVSNVYADKRNVTVDKTVARQFPFFVSAGVSGIESMHAGTINVDITPRAFTILEPDHEVTCEWIDGIRETFWLTRVSCVFEGTSHDAYIYYPCVSEQHVARDSMVELITELIPGVAYGKHIDIVWDERKVKLVE